MSQLRIPAVYMRGGTSKVVILSRSEREGCDVDHLFGRVAVDRPVIDWSGNCGDLSTAAAVSGTLVSRLVPADAHGRLRIGHPSGVLGVGAEGVPAGDDWKVCKVLMSRSARRLMEGFVRVPAP